MYDAGKIILGLVVFLALITFPIWYNAASPEAKVTPQLEKPANATECVRDVEYMTANHMDLLDEWRDKVVREGERFEPGPDGQPIERSLTNTCLSCHENKDKFCDQCHDYLGVEPYCWDCHIVPKEVK